MAWWLVEAEFSATARISSQTRTRILLVAIARALSALCDFLVLDELTTSMTADEEGRLFAALSCLRPRESAAVQLRQTGHSGISQQR